MRMRFIILVLFVAACTSSERALQPGNTPTVTAGVLSDPYQAGPLQVMSVAIEQGQASAPRPGLLYAPTAAGDYPLIQFQHGFASDIASYRFIYGRLASQGFVVFAPQMYPPGDFAGSPGIPEEVAAAVEVGVWLRAGVNSLLPAGVHADPQRYGLAGHSRGGQVAWRQLAEGGVQAQALAGVDPVDGNAPPFSMDTGPLVTGASLRFGFPQHILGTGLGRLGGPLACAPDVRNYEHFVAASEDRVYTVVASQHGHADMTDSDCLDCRAACISNPTQGMPEFSAGQLVAYFSLRLKNIAEAENYLTDVSNAPVPATASTKN